MKITKIKSVRHINEYKKIGVLELISDEKLTLSEIPETIDGFTIGTGSILRTPDGDFTIRGEEEWGDWRRSDEAVTELPDVTSADNGKVLGVVGGSWDKMEIPKIQKHTIDPFDCSNQSKITLTFEGERNIIPLYCHLVGTYMDTFIDYEPRIYAPLTYVVDNKTYVVFKAEGIPDDGVTNSRSLEFYYYELPTA